MEKDIIHFTDSNEKLISILKDQGFKLKYCQEDFFLGDKNMSAAVHPMVCFSAYDHTELQHKKITYGRYGICFSKKWATRNGLHEVLYLEKDSMPAKALAALLKARRNKNGGVPKSLRLPIIQIKCFVKNASGRNEKQNMDDFDFRGENEWRWVPNKNDIDGGFISQDRSYYKKNRDKLNEKMSRHMLTFDVPDINRIYIEKQEDISNLIEITGLDERLFHLCTWK